MQIKTFFVTGMLCALIFITRAQTGGTGSISGKLHDEYQKPVSSATVRLAPVGKTTATNHQGEFQFTELKPGSYILRISALGFKEISRKINISAGGKFQENFSLKDESRDIDEVAVVGFSKNKAVNQQAYNVTSIDAKKLYNTTLDIGQALNRVSGVRLRESGGVGSNMSFSLNGFSGNQVKMFLDGLPMDNFGSSFQLNNIPINFAERVEVYRGVVPVWLGGDALGGAVNIVTKTDPGKYLDASYSFGSFNTHKTNINAGYIDKSGLTIQLNAFQNYSDNNYKVNIQVADSVTGRYTNRRVKRFHDNYHNETLVVNAGVSNKKYADQLLFGITLGNNRSEIQTGNDMKDVYGGRETRGTIVQPGFKYLKKDLFTKGLNISLNGRFNLGEERSIDTIPRQFNWLGESTRKNKQNLPGGEASYTDFKYKNNTGLVAANATYNISEKHDLMLNHQFSTFNRKGTDAIQPDLKENKYPKITRKYITGLGYRMALSEKWNTNVFVKHYYQKGISQNVTADGTDPVRNIETNKIGYGMAATYFLQTGLQLKASYEKAYRLPSSNELFGDLVNQSDNPDLRPERSDNINLGLSYFVKLNDLHRFSVDANYVYRHAADYIRGMVGAEQPNGRRDFHYENLRSVTNNSVDANIRYYYKNLISLGGNVTYQKLINTNKVEPGKSLQSDIYKDRLPNVPYLYGNGDANIYFNNIRQKGDLLSVGYNLLYVHEFWLNWETFGSKQQFIIPQQLSHDINVVYTMASGKYNIALECLNLTDVVRYDNFALQKPGRSFNLKFRYFINK